MELNRKQLSLLISFFIMMLIVLTLFNLHLAKKQEKEILYELYFEEPPEENERETRPEENKLRTHMAYNEAATSRFDQEVREFKTLEELREGKKTEEDDTESPDDETSQEATTDTEDNYLSSASGEATIPSKGEKKQQANSSSGDGSSDAVVKNNTANIHSSISYSLVGRIHKTLPNPVYTCTSRGKIVINIKVNAAGQVTDATFNRKSSTSTNGCLIDHAITYALRSAFNREESKNEQIGTITYMFQGG